VAVVVDAARWPGGAPGEVLWIEDAATATGSLPWSDAVGTHGLGVPEAIHLGRALRCLPGRLSVLAVGIADEGQGAGLTPTVEAAVARAADLLVERVGAAVGGGS
jgi:hydrogenase maturation protease